jgi:hypothetical protein
LPKINDKDRGLALRRHEWFKPNVKYRQLHYRIEALLGKPSVCDNPKCPYHSPKRYHWSNVSGRYDSEIDLFDWQRLCAGCHKKYDKALKTEKSFKPKPLWYAKYELILQGLERG